MSLEEKHLMLQIEAPYCTLNTLTENTRFIWFCLHGYGQLARYFGRKFMALDKEENFIILPQGLSKFYLLEDHGNSRVGATWMTKEDRETEIRNQLNLLQSIWDREVGTKEYTAQVVLFGFSQGVATIGRMAAYAKFPFDKLVMWAGSFPHDLPPDAFHHLRGHEELWYFTSHDDPYFSENVYAQHMERVVSAFGKEPKVVYYEGGHRVMPERLFEIIQ
jgi:predicted esterase